MRTLFSLDTPTPVTPTMMTTKASFSPMAEAAVGQQRSAWHSPVPYLFGGLAAMLGLIAFALMILACSYWKLSSSVENGENGEGDLESGGGGGEKDRDGDGSSMTSKVYEEKFLVIMAGNEKPTFLATPSVCSSKVSCFGDGSEIVKNTEGESVENGDQKVKEMDNHEENRENHDTETQQDQEHENQ
ncbi:hypothetical protein Dsin_015231 [Dipteronia sinensis]|uniref:Uncharacterized protein n=1 Tax=Dipteronia sinensis TaxID=43782 RepID=A0AAE0AAX8_9ROSI|nr:hypothetical protein Dsin_015231 [Dipteronia sinensis]